MVRSDRKFTIPLFTGEPGVPETSMTGNWGRREGVRGPGTECTVKEDVQKGLRRETQFRGIRTGNGSTLKWK